MDAMKRSEQMLAERQHILDVAKWIASEEAGYDLCGSLAFCPLCHKEEVHPCARAEARLHQEQLREEAAYNAEQEVLESPADDAEDETAIAEETAELELAAQAEDEAAIAEETAEPELAAQDAPEGYEYVTRYRRSFRARLIQNPKAQDFYTDLKNELATLGKVRARISQAGENFRLHRQRIARLSIGGKTLHLYLALDPAAYEDSKYRFEDVSDRRTYAATPMKIRITSKRMVKYAKELIGDLAKQHGIERVDAPFKDHHAPYETDAALIEKGLIKPYRAIVKRRRRP